jgi:hypothetical protein
MVLCSILFSLYTVHASVTDCWDSESSLFVSSPHVAGGVATGLLILLLWLVFPFSILLDTTLESLEGPIPFCLAAVRVLVLAGLGLVAGLTPLLLERWFLGLLTPVFFVSGIEKRDCRLELVSWPRVGVGFVSLIVEAVT